MEDFVHLHVHTYYSILDGQSSIKKLVNKAIDDGMRGMAITDHGDMFGIKEFHDICNDVNKKRKKDGLEPFKPIFGCEMYVARRGDKNLRDQKEDLGGYHLIVLAKNYHGYKNLIKLVSNSWVDGFYNRPRTDRKDLEKYHEDLIVCSACIAGEVPAKILKGDIAGAREAIEWHKRLWGDDYYLELQRHEVKDPTIRANRETFPLQQQANKVLIELAKEYGVKLVCTNDAHFVDKENAEAHDHLLCLSTGKDLDDPTRMLYSKQEWFKTQQEMNDIFSDVPEALSNTLEILNKVETYSLDNDPIMPFFPIPEEFGTEEEWRQKFTEQQLYDEFTSDENGQNQLSPEDGEKKIKKLGGYDKIYRIKFEADYLAKLAYEGAKRRYGDPIPDEVVERVKFELHIMKTMGFPGYFLIVQDFINSARDELDVWVGPGRGSAAGSVVAYCLGITKIDPLKYDLLFERFLNPDRISLPDIDTDFDDDGRAAVLNYVTEKYGAEKVAHIVTYGTMAAKSAIKDVARVEDLSLPESNRLAKFIPSSPNEMPEDKNGKKYKITVKNCLDCFKDFRAELDNPDPKVGETIRYAEKLEGSIRSTGVHACGVIIGRDDITDWVPVSTATDSDGEKIIVTQYEGGVIESTGLIKMDFLGLKNLSIIKEALANIKLNHGIDIDIEKIPIDDPKTYELYCKGMTSGTFQFESAGMQKYLIELHPTCFEDLIAMNALYRPGPMDYIPQFINRKQGREPIEYDIPCMEQYLKETYGITVYQEQVMLLSRQLAGFTRGQSDTLRKAMGKKQIDKMNELETLFYEGGEKNGHDKKVLNKIWEDWKKFASYAFNKSHATCYSWVAYQTAYLKANYPSEYMAAVLSSNLNDVDKLSKYMDECRAMGIEVLGPNINESYKNFSATKDGRIRFGLAGIKGVGVSCVDAIVEERDKNGNYKDIFDFVQRINQGACNRKALESMALAGAFDDFKEIKREDFFEVNPRGEVFSDILMRFGQRYQVSQQEMQNSLFGAFGAIEVATPPIPKAEPWSQLERLNRERDLVGMYLSAHPLDPYYMEVTYGCDTPLAEVKSHDDEIDKELTMAGLVVDFQIRMGKKGNQFGILKIEDYTASFEFMLFGNKFVDYQKYGVIGLAIVVRGAYEKGYGDVVRFNVRSIDLLENLKGKMVRNLVISMNDEDLLNVDFLRQQLGVEGDNRCELYFRMKDQISGNYVMLRSKKLIAVDKHLLEALREAGVSYKINARL